MDGAGSPLGRTRGYGATSWDVERIVASWARPAIQRRRPESGARAIGVFLMDQGSVLVIDDVEAAIVPLSKIGQEVVRESAAQIRAAVLAFAARRRWGVVRHETFSEWASDVLRGTSERWLVLDPLFSSHALGGQTQALRVSRGATLPDSLMTQMYDALGGLDLRGTFGVLDDAVASGRTLSTLSRVISAGGGSMSRVAVCAASALGRAQIERDSRGVRFSALHPAGHVVIHLRDACPGLPHAGRPSAGLESVQSENGPIARRVPATAVLGSPWSVLAMDRDVRDALSGSWRVLTSVLRTALSREPTIGDLPLLGADVPLLYEGSEPFEAESPLTALEGRLNPPLRVQ